MIYYPRGMHQQGAFSALAYNGECPNAERLCGTVLSLPMHPYLDEAAVDAICRALLAQL